jgi:hypothetical protein
MHLVNKTSTITVAVVAALVALAIVAHASGALTLSPSYPAGHAAVQGTAARAGVPGGRPAGATAAPQPGRGAARPPGNGAGALYAQTRIGDAPASLAPPTTNT